MKRVLLFSLSLVLALISWSTVGADDGFYVVPVVKGQYAPVPKTGQTTVYATGDDGSLQKGVASPTPRFTDNNDGTVTDNLTGLIWMKNASALGQQTWTDALNTANGLQDGIADLTDGSKPGDWRLPNVNELQSLFDYGKTSPPPLPEGHPFAEVPSAIMYYYWTSTITAYIAPSAWMVYCYNGTMSYNALSNSHYVWCVRGGQ